jgi:hypothetical protein
MPTEIIHPLTISILPQNPPHFVLNKKRLLLVNVLVVAGINASNGLLSPGVFPILNGIDIPLSPNDIHTLAHLRLLLLLRLPLLQLPLFQLPLFQFPLSDHVLDPIQAPQANPTSSSQVVSCSRPTPPYTSPVICYDAPTHPESGGGSLYPIRRGAHSGCRLCQLIRVLSASTEVLSSLSGHSTAKAS